MSHHVYVLYHKEAIHKAWVTYDPLSAADHKKLRELAELYQQSFIHRKPSEGVDFHTIYKDILAANRGGEDASCSRCGHELRLHSSDGCFTSESYACNCTQQEFV